MRLRTVRAKLTALVVLSGVVLLVALPILFTVLHDQLVDEADDRAETAERSFEAELLDSLADLRLAADIIATDDGTRRGLAANDARALGDVATLFAKTYPSIDILFVAPGGDVVAQLGCKTPPKRIDEMPDLAPVTSGTGVRGMTAHGCEASEAAPPSYMIAAPVAGGGAVVVCLPIDAGYLGNAAAKLGLELALLEEGHDRILEETPAFPAVRTTGLKHAASLIESGHKRWAVAHLAPKSLRGPAHTYALVSAVDVTPLGEIVRRSMLKFAIALLGATALSLFAGWRLASVMGRALRRVNTALKKLEQQEYVHVEGVRTGDELEDLASGFNTMVDGLVERDKLRTTFGKYMTASVIEHLMSGKVQLGGVSIKVTVLFTDIRGFTSISEKMDAQAVVALLNEYFTEMVSVVMEEEGVVDKYIGDAIMAVFGAPVPKPDDAIRAVRAAVRMRAALAALNERLVARGTTPIKTGIGIHTGEVVAGNIGSESRMEYTVIGDAVNLASRLESNTKDLGANVLISEDTYLLTKNQIEARPVKEIYVKGRAQPVMTYEVVGLKGEEPLPLSEESRARRRSSHPPATSE